jgi:uncharacterized protein (TIGR02271 family)
MGDLFGSLEDQADKTEVTEDAKLRLHREELDISKDRVQTGAVNLRKEVVEEQKTVNVPVTHDEVVIERRALNNEVTDEPISAEETIHIPVSEEQVEVGKHTVLTGEIAARKREVEEMKQVDETLKREEARVDTEGDPNIVENEIDNHLQ